MSLESRVETLFAAIAHGDADHRAWLKDAISAHMAGQPVPAPRGAGNKEKRIVELEETLAQLLRGALAIAEHFKIDVAAEMVRDPKSPFAMAINALVPNTPEGDG